jgi:hypothetical protein
MSITSLADPIMQTATIETHLTTFPLSSTTGSLAGLVYILVVQVTAFGHFIPTISARTYTHRIELLRLFCRLESHFFAVVKGDPTFIYACLIGR